MLYLWTVGGWLPPFRASFPHHAGHTWPPRHRGEGHKSGRLCLSVFTEHWRSAKCFPQTLFFRVISPWSRCDIILNLLCAVGQWAVTVTWHLSRQYVSSKVVEQLRKPLPPHTPFWHWNVFPTFIPTSRSNWPIVWRRDSKQGLHFFFHSWANRVCHFWCYEQVEQYERLPREKILYPTNPPNQTSPFWSDAPIGRTT